MFASRLIALELAHQLLATKLLAFPQDARVSACFRLMGVVECETAGNHG
jgi:hypothetical protein